MIEVAVPGWQTLRLEYLVLDVNGTLSLDGELLPGVSERVAALANLLQVHLLSADTFGRLDALAETLGVQATRLRPSGSEAGQKADFVRALGASSVAAIGNGANDAAMLRAAGLGIAVLGPEGLATGSAQAADILVASIADALDLLLHPRRLTATLRR
jgi:P-type E1-E2 ATPase